MALDLEACLEPIAALTELFENRRYRPRVQKAQDICWVKCRSHDTHPVAGAQHLERGRVCYHQEVATSPYLPHTKAAASHEEGKHGTM